MQQDKLTIYYDGHCPLCSLEMQKLINSDQKKSIILVDLRQPNFAEKYPQIALNKALKILHGEYQGNLLLALDVTHRAWSLVGRGYYVAPLQWPIVKQIAHLIYLVVANYRYPISSFIYKRFGIGIKICKQGTCYEKPNDINHRGE